MKVKMLSRQLLYVFLIVMVSSYFWWRQSNNHVFSSTHINYPDIVLYEVNGVTMNDQGYSEYYLTAPEIKHDMVYKLTRFSYPIIQLADNKQQLWQIIADSADANTNFSIIHLISHVNIQQITSAANDHTSIITDKLTLLPREKKASNGVPVSIKQNGNELNGNGLRIDLNTGLVQLLANIQAIYAL